MTPVILTILNLTWMMLFCGKADISGLAFRLFLFPTDLIKGYDEATKTHVQGNPEWVGRHKGTTMLIKFGTGGV